MAMDEPSGEGSNDRRDIEKLADFACSARWEDLSESARRELKIRVLDSLGCAIGALEGEPVRLLRQQVEEFGGRSLCTLIGGGRSAPDRTAFYHGAVVRYLDFNDSYLAPGETCHPSDHLGAVLAASEYAPELDVDRAANAIAIAGTAYNALRVTRTGTLSHWKGLAMPNAARCALHAAFLARRGVTGPPEMFEGNKGWRRTVSSDWSLDWAAEDLEAVTRTDLKKYNAEIHSQSAVEGVLELLDEHGLTAPEIERVELDVFPVAYDIIGGGEEGGKTDVATKEEADRSLPYIVAVALLDGGVHPEQYEPDRIAADDVQELLRRVEIRPDATFSEPFPGEHARRVTLVTRDGRHVSTEKSAYEGVHAEPMPWPAVEAKFRRLAAPRADPGLQDELVSVCRSLDEHDVDELMDLLARVG